MEIKKVDEIKKNGKVMGYEVTIIDGGVERIECFVDDGTWFDLIDGEEKFIKQIKDNKVNLNKVIIEDENDKVKSEIKKFKRKVIVE